MAAVRVVEESDNAAGKEGRMVVRENEQLNRKCISKERERAIRSTDDKYSKSQTAFVCSLSCKIPEQTTKCHCRDTLRSKVIKLDRDIFSRHKLARRLLAGAKFYSAYFTNILSRRHV